MAQRARTLRKKKALLDGSSAFGDGSQETAGALPRRSKCADARPKLGSKGVPACLHLRLRPPCACPRPRGTPGGVATAPNMLAMSASSSRAQDRQRSFKKGIDSDAIRRQREDTTIQIRKTLRGDRLNQRRRMSLVVRLLSPSFLSSSWSRRAACACSRLTACAMAGRGVRDEGRQYGRHRAAGARDPVAERRKRKRPSLCCRRQSFAGLTGFQTDKQALTRRGRYLWDTRSPICPRSPL